MPMPIILLGAVVGIGVVLISESRAKSMRTDGQLPGEGVEGTVAGERPSETGKVKAIDDKGQAVPMIPTDIGYKPDVDAMEDVPQPTESGFPDMVPNQADEAVASPSAAEVGRRLGSSFGAAFGQKPPTTPVQKPFPAQGGKGEGGRVTGRLEETTRVIPVFKTSTRGMTKIRAGAVLSGGRGSNKVIF